jgi:TetR/AcrR family transcriptional regulator, transcriptional repressor for nem operon
MKYTAKALRTRSRILDCAAELMFSQGYAHLKLDEVLLASNVRKGNFYYYFASKDDLCLSVLRERAKPLLLHWIDKHISSTGDPWENLQQLIAALSAQPDRVPEQGNPLSNLALEMAGFSDEFRQEMDSLLGEVVAIYTREFRRLSQQGRLRPGTDPQHMARYLFSIVEGALLLFRCDRDLDRFQRTVQMGMSVVQAELAPVSQN